MPYSIEQIKEMQELRAQGMKLKDIASMFGCGIDTIYRKCRCIKKPLIGQKQSCKNYYQRNKERLKKKALDRYYNK